jgi:hypothetical protein
VLKKFCVVGHRVARLASMPGGPIRLSRAAFT